MTLFVESYHFLKIGIIYYLYGVFLTQLFCYDRFLGFELVVGVAVCLFSSRALTQACMSSFVELKRCGARIVQEKISYHSLIASNGLRLSWILT
jgi:hypothetical protein